MVCVLHDLTLAAQFADAPFIPFEQDAWGYWKQISCSGDVASENACAWKVPEDGAYGWTRRPC
ncbi:hypothetical protein [Roseovarius nitratireducens]|uniref:hypothetical protein n=1 Tax=Roseovarius nitratireducens TaxID=2044597 RepID=UPI000CE19C51|nr:hypothetical protein [Roseovarius nitratireducens]